MEIEQDFGAQLIIRNSGDIEFISSFPASGKRGLFHRIPATSDNRSHQRKSKYSSPFPSLRLSLRAQFTRRVATATRPGEAGDLPMLRKGPFGLR